MIPKGLVFFNYFIVHCVYINHQKFRRKNFRTNFNSIFFSHKQSKTTWNQRKEK